MIAAAMGWIGTIGTMGAYVMLSRGQWHSASLRYAAFNGAGGLMCAAASAAYGAWPSVASNLLWSVVVVAPLRPVPDPPTDGPTNDPAVLLRAA